MRVLILLLLYVPYLASAAGDESIRQDFARSQSALPRALIHMGSPRFGDLELSRFLGDLSGIRVQIVKAMAHVEHIGPFLAERDSAAWNRELKTIALNGPLWQKTVGKAKPMLALHESMGALGYADNNFDCSGTLWILANAKGRAVLTVTERTQFEDYARKACVLAQAQSGSSTGVTGGGDDYNVLVRIGIFERGLAQAEAATDGNARAAALAQIAGGFYGVYGINPHHHTFDRKNFLNSQRLDRKPVISSIRVMTIDGETIPYDENNGWTYDKALNSVLYHGSARPRPGATVGPVVSCQWEN